MIRARAGLALTVGTALLSLAALQVPAARPAWAGSFLIAPNKFEFSLNRRYTNFFTITNDSEEVTSMRIYAQSVTLNDANQVVERAGAPGDMTEWVVINPRRITLGPQEKRVVRFSVRPPDKPAPGEYFTFVFFEELPPPPQEAPGKTTGTGVQLNLLTRLGAALWGQVGASEFKIALVPGKAEWPGEKLDYTGAVINEGTAHVILSLEAKLLDAGGSAVREKKEDIVIFRGDTRRIGLDWKRPPPGEYSLQVFVEGEQVPPAESKVSLVVPRAKEN